MFYETLEEDCWRVDRNYGLVDLSFHDYPFCLMNFEILLLDACMIRIVFFFVVVESTHFFFR